MKAATTLPRLLSRNAVGFGARPAWREKRGGIWQVLNWSDYALLVSCLAAGLAAHGFGRGDRLAVIGDNRPRLYAAMLAAQSLGGAAVPLRPDAGPDWIVPGPEPRQRVDRRRGGRGAGGKDRCGQGPIAWASSCCANDVARHAPT